MTSFQYTRCQYYDKTRNINIEISNAGNYHEIYVSGIEESNSNECDLTIIQGNKTTKELVRIDAIGMHVIADTCIPNAVLTSKTTFHDEFSNALLQTRIAITNVVNILDELKSEYFRGTNVLDMLSDQGNVLDKLQNSVCMFPKSNNLIRTLYYLLTVNGYKNIIIVYIMSCQKKLME